MLFRSYNYLLAFPDNPDLMPAVMTFQRSSIKVGRNFNTKIKTVRTPLYGSIYEFSSFKDVNKGGDEFHNIAVKGAGLVEDENMYNAYKSMSQSYNNTGINIKDIESLQEDADADTGGDAGQDGDGPQM